ncbi:hypothetical protein B0J14DRAFT_565935 [Halenospora varia]|nr:hypothetical protein B0J14DRAFT_565935 [Halenospora varia]
MEDKSLNLLFSRQQALSNFSVIFKCDVRIVTFGGRCAAVLAVKDGRKLVELKDHKHDWMNKREAAIEELLKISERTLREIYAGRSEGSITASGEKEFDDAETLSDWDKGCNEKKELH